MMSKRSKAGLLGLHSVCTKKSQPIKSSIGHCSKSLAGQIHLLPNPNSLQLNMNGPAKPIGPGLIRTKVLTKQQFSPPLLPWFFPSAFRLQLIGSLRRLQFARSTCPSIWWIPKLYESGVVRRPRPKHARLQLCSWIAGRPPPPRRFLSSFPLCRFCRCERHHMLPET